jgi:hypothetical protein
VAQDGLTYQSPEHPGAFYDAFTKKQNKPVADIGGESRYIIARSNWLQLSSDPIFRELAERKINRFLELAVRPRLRHLKAKIMFMQAAHDRAGSQILAPDVHIQPDRVVLEHRVRDQRPAIVANQRVIDAIRVRGHGIRVAEA